MAWQEAVTVDRVIELLNELIELDREAVSKLIDARVTCSQPLTDHPTVQVGQREDGTFRVGVLGLLNWVSPISVRIYTLRVVHLQ
jgi:hypothetical protein